jgi:hypothetical protein
MLRADGLLVLQASNCNEQIPAKLYEYFRARRPLLVLTDPAGDTAATALKAGVERVARLDSPSEIASLLDSFVVSAALHGRLMPTEVAVQAASRRGRTESLAAVLDEVASRS